MKQPLFIGVFLTGFCVMVLELLGVRIVAPYLGSSLYVWTALIGVILGFLSLGYYLGGELSERNASFNKLGQLVLGAGVWVFATALTKEVLMESLVRLISSGYVQSIVASTVLFGLPSLLLGAVSPYAARLLISSVNSSGVSVGRLYAVSTLGSILGTFATGFWLVPTYGHLRIMYLVALLLFGVSLIFSLSFGWLKCALVAISLLALWQKWVLPTNKTQSLVLDLDTAYSRVWVQDYPTPRGIERDMVINSAHSSGIVLGNDNLLAFGYYPYYDLMFWRQKKLDQVLMIGGAGMGYPKYLVNNFPDTTLTVVEIDEKLTEIAQREMGYQPSKKISLVFEDGRKFLNGTNRKFDAVLIDAFSEFTIPGHLVSLEAVKEIDRVLNSDGIVVANIIGSLSGDKANIPQAILATYRQVFPEVRVFAVQNPQDLKRVQNLVLVAAKTPLTSQDNQLSNNARQLLLNEINLEPAHQVLTDDWSPIDSYTVKLVTR